MSEVEEGLTSPRCRASGVRGADYPRIPWHWARWAVEAPSGGGLAANRWRSPRQLPRALHAGRVYWVARDRETMGRHVAPEVRERNKVE